MQRQRTLIYCWCACNLEHIMENSMEYSQNLKKIHLYNTLCILCVHAQGCVYMYMWVCVLTCVFVCVRQRERETKRQRQKQRQRRSAVNVENLLQHSHPNFLRRSLQMDSEMNNLFWLPGLPAHTSSSTVLGVQACSFGFHFYVGVGEVLKLGWKHI